MNKILKLNFSKSKKISSLLGLALDGSRLDGVVLRRSNGSVQLQQTFTVTLALDPLTGDPELVGREIRDQLDAAGIRERNCIVALPLKWALTVHAKLPDLPEADIAGFLQIEAERGFPTDASTLRISNSHCHFASGEQYVTMAGIPASHSAQLEQALRFAKLKPLSFSLGITALQPQGTDSSNGVLALVVGENHIGLQITSGGGVASLRALEGVLESEGGEKTLHGDLIAREARITLGQLPDELRDSVKRIRIFGRRELAEKLAEEIRPRFEPMGIKVEVVTQYAANEFGVMIPSNTAVSSAFSLAARKLAGQTQAFEFLAPKVSAWQQMTRRYSSGKLRSAGLAAAAVVLIIGMLFAFQQWQLFRLNSRWEKMSAKVTDLQAFQDKIRQFRPWYDDSIQCLSILRQLTAAFPQDGIVTAKTIEIKDMNSVTCTGTTRDTDALLKTVERLRSSPNVAFVTMGPIRGQTQKQFTFDFRWQEGGRREN